MIQITIVDDSSQQECNAACGMDWSSPEVINMASQQIKERFGQGFELQCLDLARAATSDDASEWSDLVQERNLSLPLLLLNGQPRISGEFDIRQLINAVEAEMEMGGQRR